MERLGGRVRNTTSGIGRRGLVAGAAVLPAAAARAQAKSEISITRQPSIIYMPLVIMEARKLVEAQAAKLGLPPLTVKWVTFNGGGAATDALLAGGVDVVNTGAGNMLVLWDRTKGRVKGFAATCAEPLVFISRDPRIQSLRDIGPTDRIAVPTLKVSTQAVLLSIAAVQMFGAGDAGHFDANCVQLGHPDALAQLLDPRGTVANHFSAPPFFAQALKRVAGAHIVTDSTTILGGPLSQAVLFCTTAFADANPGTLKAIRAATAEATAMIRSDPAAAVRIYKEASNDALSEADLLEVLRMPGMSDFGVDPQGTMRFATHLAATGILKTKPDSWKDYFFPSAHDLNGS